MRTSVIPVALLAMCIFISASYCLAQQPVASQSSGDENNRFCTIAGTVVSANTGEPLKKAHVLLYRADSSDHPLAASTDATGHFSIDKIPEGRYDLEVDRANYLDMRYGQDQLDKPGALLSLAAGQKITDLLFRLHRTAVITGRVLDEDDDPVRDASVTAVAHTLVHGRTKIESSGSVNTNDLGVYRIVDLAPGRYLILANPPEASPMREPSEQTVDYLPTYYPGTTERVRASTLEVKSGDEITGIDFVFVPKLPTRGYKIHGHVLNSLTEYPDSNVVVILFPRAISRDPDLDSDQKQSTADTKTGEFEIKNVTPGEYVAAAMSYAGGKRRIATQNVDVINADVDGVSLVLTRGIDIPVRVTLEGKAAASAADVGVFLYPAEDGTTINLAPGQEAVAQPDGSFILKEIGDGSYSLGVHSKCRECYLKSARANGVDLLEQGVQVAAGAAPSPIAIVYSSNSGTLTGAVTSKDDLPAPGALVVLVPDSDFHQKPRQFKNSTTDQYGHFEIRGVPPGRYKAFAWERIDESSYGDPDFLKSFESMAESFDIAGDEQKTVQLKMIPAVDSAN
jgi:hypothetical protein